MGPGIRGEQDEPEHQAVKDGGKMSWQDRSHAGVGPDGKESPAPLHLPIL